MSSYALRKFSTPRPCTFYLQGKCTRGDACTYEHPRAGPPGRVAPTASSIIKTPCKYFLRGACTNPRCPFAHSDPSKASTVAAKAPPPPNSCAFYAQGYCRFGDQCLFYHPVAEITAQTRPLPTSIPTRATTPRLAVPPPDVQPASNLDASTSPHPVDTPNDAPRITRTIYACSVTFGPGLAVERLSTDLESTRLILNNLPADILSAEVEELVAVFGAADAHILASSVRPMALADFAEAGAARAAADALDRATYRGRVLAARLEPRAPDRDAGVLRDTAVKVAWFAPSCVAYAHYGTAARAKREQSRTHCREFDGRKISTTFQAPTLRQKTSFTVVVTGLSAEVIPGQLSTFMKCNTVSITRPRFNVASGIKKLRESLDVEEGCLEAFDVLPAGPGDTKLKAIARYTSTANARAAVDSLHGEKMPYLNGSPVWLSHLQAVKFALPRAQYVALAPRIASLQEAEEGDLRWSVFDRTTDGAESPVVTIRISGDDTQALGRRKVKMEAILLGRIVKVDDETAWDDQLTAEEGREAVEKIAEAVGGYARCDIGRHHVAVYAPEAQSEASLHGLVAGIITQMRLRRRDIALDANSFRRLVHHGLRALQDQYGADRVGLDVLRRCLTTRLEHSQLAAVRAYLAQMEGTPALPAALGIECPVCLCDVTDAVMLTCTHQLCGPCIDLLITSASTFPIACIYDACQEPLALALLQTRLTPPALDALLDRAGAAHISQRPGEYKFCPTPGCAHVYRTAPEGAVLRCGGCLADTCGACHVPAHPGFTCAERRAEADPAERAYRQWKRDNAVKPCPRCGVDIQKSAGCNHMTCAACKTHMCWACMKTFEVGHDVYEHMRIAHGGIGV